jgi:serine/threonine-protein kinase
LEASVSLPFDLQFDSADNLYISDASDHVVRFVSKASGIIITVAGQVRRYAPFIDTVAATFATLNSPEGFIILPDKTAFIGDSSNNRIRSLSALPFGPGRYNSLRACPTINTVLGNGTPISAGNGGPPSAATVNSPTGLAFDKCASTLYFSDRDGHSVRSIKNSIVSTFAGTGTGSSTGDLGPALSATLKRPDGLAVANGGSVYIVESEGNRLRMVAPNGYISTVAGTGSGGCLELGVGWFVFFYVG